MKFKVIVVEDEEDGGYNVSCPALRGCHSQGETIEEALTNIKEAIEAYLESLKKDAMPIPNAPQILEVEVSV